MAEEGKDVSVRSGKQLELPRVLSEIKVVAHREAFFRASQDLFKLANIENPRERNLAYYEEGGKFVRQEVGDLPNKIVADDLRRVDVKNVKNIQFTGMGVGIDAQDFSFTNSVSLSQNGFMFACNGKLEGLIAIGDNSFRGGIHTKGDLRIYRMQNKAPLPKNSNVLENFYVYGSHVFGQARGGSLRNGIIASPDDMLKNAFDVLLEHVYLVRPSGIIYVDKYRVASRGITNIPGIPVPQVA